LSSRRFDPRSLGRTPRLAQRLGRLDSALTRAAHLHGFGTLVTGAALWLGFTFVADYYLGVPHAVRMMHLLMLLGLVAFLGWRYWVRPLRRRPDARGLALLAERATPGSHELFVSAVEFQTGESARSLAAGTADSALRQALVERVYAAADLQGSSLNFGPILDAKPALKRFLLGLLAATALGAGALAQPEKVGIFLRRLLGGVEPWPQRTQLSLDVRASEGRVRVERESDARGELLRVSLPRGSDLPVTVLADGELPREVWLEFDSGERTQLSASGPRSFSTVLRGLGQELSFNVRGGDDRDGRPRLELTLLEPPDILASLLEITPPNYSGLSIERSAEGSVRALIGSRIRGFVQPSGQDVRGQVRLLPEDRLIDLVEVPFPAEAGENPVTGLGFEFELLAGTHLRFELLDSQGLANPDPGLISIEALQDGAPELFLHTPQRSEIETVASALLTARVRVEDDFGLSAAGFAFRLGEADDWQVQRTLDLLPLPPGSLEQEAGASKRRQPRARGWLVGRFELSKLAELASAGSGALAEPASGTSEVGAAPQDSAALSPGPAGAAPLAPAEPLLAAGNTLVFELWAQDNRLPAQTGKSTQLRVRIVSDDEFLRRLQDRLADARQKADVLTQAQRERHQRVLELTGALAEASNREALESRDLSAALNGQRRIEADAEGLLRELAAVAESALYARLEPAAEPWLERLDGLLSGQASKRFESAPWLELASLAKAASGPSTLSGHLIELVELARQVREEGALAASAALQELLQAPPDVSRQLELLARASERQTYTLTRLEDLLERLKEWDNFQSVLSLTRDILNRQKALQERLKQHAAK
jgi:hypothetical protein